eukprot:6482326-Amphidinium_carterae.2
MCFHSFLSRAYRVEQCKYLETQGVEQAMIGLSDGRLREVVFEMLVKFFSSDFALKLGLCGLSAVERDLTEESEVTKSQFELLMAAMAELLLSDLSFAEPPKRFVLLLLDPSDTRHVETLRYLQRLYTGVLALESTASRTGNKGLSKWLRELVWTESAWTREVLETLRADNWQLQREYLRASLVDYARSWRSTLICENGNRLGRSKESGATGKSSVLRLWHHLQNASGIVGQYGREACKAEGSQSKDLLTDEFFRPDLGETSIPAAKVDELLQPAPMFPTHTAADYKLASLHT